MRLPRAGGGLGSFALLILATIAGTASAAAQGTDPVPPGTTWTMAAAGDALITRQVGTFPAFVALVGLTRAADVAVLNFEVNLFRLWEFKGFPQAENGGNYELGPPPERENEQVAHPRTH